MKAIYAYRPSDRTTHPEGIEKRSPDTLASWLRHFPDSVPTDRDPEDFLENATILEHADKLGLNLTILPPNDGNMFVSGSGWYAPPARPGSPVATMLGSWSTRDLMMGLPIDVNIVGTTKRAVAAAGNYAASATFQRHAGRPMTLATGNVEGEGGLEAALRFITDQAGTGDIFAKTVQKGWAAKLSVDLTKSDKRLWDQLADADMEIERKSGGSRGRGLSWIPVKNEGSKAPILLIQGRIAPTFEYRILVIDGRPVTGSGCIEVFTPAENLGDAFDPQMEAVRSNGDIVQRPDLVERYMAFADMFCAEFAAEHGDGLDYGLDVCIDANTGQVVPIEINPPINLGMYARSTQAWMTAVIERTERMAGEGVVTEDDDEDEGEEWTD